MKTRDTVLANRPQIRAARVLFHGCTDIAFCPYGEYWRQAEKICVLEILSQKRVQDFQYVREEEAVEMVKKIRDSCMNGATIDLGAMFVNISSNIICRTALGRMYEGEDVLDQIIEEHQKSDGGDQSDKKDFVDILLNLQKNDRASNLNKLLQFDPIDLALPCSPR
ncbi:cytochrome p450 71a1 [Quercus suber]|uniref:Cytochrome p450 71a1 n=1 Tax=Quercus suber TaxID=58331 RepID=A0AAW0LPJ8_QUESU